MRNDIHGILVVDKQEDMTSATVVAHVKRLCGVAKVGHTGTLDPLATGVLVCCLNKATKLATFFLRGRKKYEAVLHLGVETDTQDGTGKVLSASDAVAFSDKAIEKAIQAFVGPIDQQPPVYSALKHKGVPLHKLARSGKVVIKPPRSVHISSINIKKIALPLVYIEISCSAGTYIRTLCSDIGKALGCGGHLKALRRTESSGFSIKDAVTLADLERIVQSENKEQRLAELIVPMADTLTDVPEISVNESLTQTISKGQPLTAKEIAPMETLSADRLVKVVDSNRHLLAVLRYEPTTQTYSYCCVFHRYEVGKWDIFREDNTKL